MNKRTFTDLTKYAGCPVVIPTNVCDCCGCQQRHPCYRRFCEDCCVPNHSREINLPQRMYVSDLISTRLGSTARIRWRVTPKAAALMNHYD